MNVEFWATTDTGRVRDHNEDNFLVDTELNLFVVCDGMGGHAGGEVASALSIRTIHEVIGDHRDVVANVRANPDDPAGRRALCDLLDTAISRASDRVYRAAQRDTKRGGMGTTCSALMVAASHGFVGHVGDSRIYRKRGPQVEQLTDDHSLLNEMIRQGRAKQGDSIANANAVTRAVGVHDSVEVDTFEFDIATDDVFVLCSDGLSGYVDRHAQLAELIDDTDLEASAHRCIGHALDGGGKDNITAIIARAGAAGASESTVLSSQSLGALAGCKYFGHATPSDLARLTDIAEGHAFDAGATILEAQTAADALCLIIKGSVGVQSPHIDAHQLGAGDSFGAVGLMTGAPSREIYQALSPTQLFVFHRDRLFDVLRERPHLASKVLFELAESMAEQLAEVPAALRHDPDLWESVRIESQDQPGQAGFPPAKRSDDDAAGELSDTDPNNSVDIGSSDSAPGLAGEVRPTSPSNSVDLARADGARARPAQTSGHSMGSTDQSPRNDDSHGEAQDLRTTIQLDIDDEDVEEL